MTITIDLPIEVETKIKSQAVKQGLGVDDYVRSIVKDTADRRANIEAAAGKSFDEILAPIRKGFAESGMSEDEILEFFEAERDLLWKERHSEK